jgi:hypothetical protein
MDGQDNQDKKRKNPLNTKSKVLAITPHLLWLLTLVVIQNILCVLFVHV